MANDAILAELREIKFHLSLLTHELRFRAFGLFEAEVLRTNRRTNMFRAFDGTRTPAQIGEMTDVTDQGVRDLIRDMENAGFVSVARDTRGAQVASVNVGAVLNWYFSRPESQR